MEPMGRYTPVYALLVLLLLHCFPFLPRVLLHFRGLRFSGLGFKDLGNLGFRGLGVRGLG